MKKDNSVYLDDILGAITRIEEFVAGKSNQDWLSNRMLEDAVIRNFEIIGEASTRLSDEFIKENPNFPIREAISMRNLLIHEYDHVKLDKVWEAITCDLPPLKKRVEELL